MNTFRGRIIIAFAIVYVVWGSTYLGIRVAVETIPPFVLAATRQLAAGALLLALVRWRGRGTPRPAATRAEWGGAAIMGTLMFLLGNGLLSWAETRIDSGLAALLVGAIPLWVVILERFNPVGTRRPVTLQKALGVAVGLAGLALLVWPTDHGGIRMDPLAIILVMIGSLGWAFGTVIGPTLPHPKDKMENAAMTMLAGGGIVLVVALVKGEFAGLTGATISARSWAAWWYLVVFGSMLAYSAYVWLMAHVEAGKIATYALVNPIVAVFLGWLLVGEAVTAKMLLATLIILAGLALTLFGSEAAAWAGRTARTTGRQIRQAMLL
jgi:drug/metabolite transporter (DMT)-like permease